MNKFVCFALSLSHNEKKEIGKGEERERERRLSHEKIARKGATM